MSESILKAVAAAIAESARASEKRLDEVAKSIPSLEGLATNAVVDQLAASVSDVLSLNDAVAELSKNVAAIPSFEGMATQDDIANLSANISSIDATEAITSIKAAIASQLEANETFNELIEGLVACDDATQARMESIAKDMAAAQDEMRSDIVQLVRKLGIDIDQRIAEIKMLPGADGVDGKDGKDGIDGIDGADGVAGKDGKDGAGIVAKQWASGVYRKDTIVQHNIGQYFIAKCDTADEPGSQDWDRIGTAGFRHCGAFDDARKYEAGDMYVKDFGTFICIGEKTICLAGRGAKGDAGKSIKGEKGDQGDKGEQGPTPDSIIVQDDGSLAFVYPNGMAKVAYGLEEYIQRALLDNETANYTDETPPIKVFRGIFDVTKSYQRGDVVRLGLDLAVCYKAHAPYEDFMRCFIAMTTAGGGGGIGSPPVASPFNVVANQALLPAAGAGHGDTYFTLDNNLLHVWDNTNGLWKDMSGIHAVTTATGLPATGSPGDVYLTTDDHALNMWVGGKWVKNLDGAYVAASATEASAITAAPDGRLLFRSDIPEVFVASQGKWVSTIGGPPVHVVANLAAMNQIANPQSGWLAYRHDVGELFVFDNGVWNASEHVIHVYANETARLSDRNVLAGSFGFQRDTSSLYIRDNNAWTEVSGAGGGIMSVADQAARYALQPAKVKQGLLVYQIDTGVTWQYTGATPVTAALIKAPGSWTQITSVGVTPKVIEVKNAAALPSATAAAADKSNPLYLIREDTAGDPLNRLVWFKDTTPAPTVAVPNPAASGTWVLVNTEVFVKSLVSDPDYSGQRRDGDVSIAIEPDHAQMKVFANGNWHMLFNEDEIRSWIAAGSLFQGTVMNKPVAGGATELDQLPVPDSSWKGYYWTWTGSSGFHVSNGADVQADPAYRAILFALTPATLPGTAGDALDVAVTVAGGGSVGVSRPITILVTTTGNADAGSKYIVIDADAADTGAMLAQKLKQAWVDGTIGLDATRAGHTLTLTPTVAAIAISEFSPFQDGATPVIGDDLNGTTLQVGDWLQVVTDITSGGYRWAHVPADLLSKIRGDRLYSLQPWAAGSWERNSIVNHDCRIWRATRDVGATDVAPQLAGVPITVIGQTLIAYPATTAGAQAFLTNNVVGPANGGNYIILDTGASGTLATPQGTAVVANDGDAIINAGNNLVGLDGFVVVPGPFPVGSTPAIVVNATPRTSISSPQGAIPIPSTARLQQQIGGANVLGQRLVMTASFVVPPGLPFAGTRVDAGDTLWYTGDNAVGNQGWLLEKGAVLGANDQPPFVPTAPIAQHITNAAVGQSVLDLLLQDMAANGLSNGDVITINAPGTLGLAATNAPIGTALAIGNYVEVTNAATNQFRYFVGPYQAGVGVPVTVTPTFIRGYGSGWADVNTDDISDIFTRANHAVGDTYGWVGGGSAKTVQSAWQSAGNLAGQSLPNTNGIWYFITLASLSPITWVTYQNAVTSWPANQSTLPDVTTNVISSAPARDVSAAAGVAFTWANFASTVDWTNAGTAPNDFSVNVGQYFVVDEAASPVPAGPGAGNIAGQNVQVGSRVYMTRLAPVRWMVAATGSFPPANIFIEGQQPVDPATLSHNRPQMLLPPNPTPRTTVPGIPTASSPWENICTSGNWKTVLNDSELPAGGAASNEVYFVASSARNANLPTLYASYNGNWERLGGSAGATGGSGGISVVQALPPAHTAGDAYFHQPTSSVHVSDGSRLAQINTIPTGKFNSDNILEGNNEGIFKWSSGHWARGSVVDESGGLYRATRETDNYTPAPSQDIAILIAATTKVADWDNDLSADPDALIQQGIGAYALVGNNAVTNINLGTPGYLHTFPAGSRVVWTGSRSMNFTRTNGDLVVDGLWIIPASGQLPPANYTFSEPNDAWEYIGHVGAGIYYTQGSGAAGVASAPRPHVTGDLLIGHSGAQDHPRILAVSDDGRRWTNYGGAGKVLPAMYYGATPPANPLRGDFWMDNTTSILKLRVYNGSAWTDSIGAVWHGPAASKPAANVSHIGDIYIEDDGHKIVWMMTQSGWIELVDPTASVHSEDQIYSGTQFLYSPTIQAADYFKITGICAPSGNKGFIKLIAANDQSGGYIDWASVNPAHWWSLPPNNTGLITNNLSNENPEAPFDQWNAAGALLTHSDFWEGRPVLIELEMRKVGNKSQLIYSILGKDGNGTTRDVKAFFFFDQIFPVKRFGLKFDGTGVNGGHFNVHLEHR